MLLKDKVVVVSGVGPGMGQALAKIAAAEGARVVLGARTVSYLEQIRDEIETDGGEAIIAQCDVSDAAQCKALAEAAASAFGGRIDGLVNSAFRHGERNHVEDTVEEDFHSSYDVNCLGALRMTKACLPYMKDAGGAIVNISSMTTVRPWGAEDGLEINYSASKGALNILGKYMAADLGKYRIRVNTCRMGWMYGTTVQAFIDGELASGRKLEDVLGEITKDIPIGVIPPQEECAKSALMLLSDYATMVTGQSLDVNGGQWMAA